MEQTTLSCDAEQFSWSQTGEDVTVTVPLAAKTKRADIKVKVQPFQLSIVVGGLEICSGRLAKEVEPEESSWTLEGGGEKRCLAVCMAKKQQKSSVLWPCLWKKDIPLATEHVTLDQSATEALVADAKLHQSWASKEHADDPELSLKGYDHDSAPACPRFVDVNPPEGMGIDTNKSNWEEDRPEYHGWKEAAKEFAKQTILDLVEKDEWSPSAEKAASAAKSAEATELTAKVDELTSKNAELKQDGPVIEELLE